MKHFLALLVASGLMAEQARADVPAADFVETYYSNGNAHITCGFFGADLLSGVERHELNLYTDLTDTQYAELQTNLASGLALVSFGVHEYLDSLNNAEAAFDYDVEIYYNGTPVYANSRARAVYFGSVGAEVNRTRIYEIPLPATLDISDRGEFSMKLSVTSEATCLARGSGNQAHAHAMLRAPFPTWASVTLAYDTP